MRRIVPRSLLTLGLALGGLAMTGRPAGAFCGFYVGKADAKLFNKASQVVLVRDGDRTVLSMMNDYQGELTEFALVVPVPTFLEREQIHVGDAAIIEHLDAFSAPRLVEYFDEDPCGRQNWGQVKGYMGDARAPAAMEEDAAARSRGVTIEARYTVGEYDILILSAKESEGLELWLRENGYKVPSGASRVLGSYLKQGMRFFVARVNLTEQAKLGFSNLRPLQMAYESPKFMLPIRLGMVNADGSQDLLVYALTRNGRVETTNYRTVRLPTGMDLPVFVRDEFADFYKAMFAEQVEKESMRAVFLEYAWDMSWCDPCASAPLSDEELRELGVFWLNDTPGTRDRRPSIQPPPGGAREVFVTRLHVRYDAEHFPEDLVFMQTGDRENFQGRYVLRHAWKGSGDCDEARRYREDLRRRRHEEATQLASLTGWDLDEIHRKMQRSGDDLDPIEDSPWWDKIWKR